MTRITQLSQLDLEATYSYADYLTWQLDKTVELIRGKIVLMSPAPNVKHQSISWQLNGLLFQYFKDKACHAFAAPFDVRLYDQQKSTKSDQDIYTVVQPDLCIICDQGKITEQGCLGAPDWILADDITHRNSSTALIGLRADRQSSRHYVRFRSGAWQANHARN